MVFVKNKKIAAILATVIFAGTINIPFASAETADTAYPSFYEDFESYNVGDVPSFINLDSSMSGSCVVEDEKGNKVFMLKYTGKDNWKMMNIDLGQVFNKGRYNYDYKLRFKNLTGKIGFSPAMTLSTDKSSTSGIMTRQIITQGFVFDGGYIVGFSRPGLKNSDGYYDIQSYIDLDNKKQKVPAQSGTGLSERNLSGNSFRYINVQTYNGVAPTIGEGNSADSDVIYIDDIRVEPDTLKITNKNIKNNDIVDISKVLELTFNENVKSIDKAKIEIKESKTTFENGVISTGTNTLTAEEFDAEVSDSKLTINAKGGWSFGAEYEITLKDGAVAPTSKLATSYDTIKFSTKGIIDEISGVKDNDIYTADLNTNKYTVAVTVPGDVTAQLYLSSNGGEFTQFKNPSELGEGEYILAAVAEKDGKSQVKAVSFEIITAKAPYAEDVKIDGEMFVGSTLSGKYTFKDDNKTDKEGKTEFRWKRLNKSTNEWEYITADGKEYSEQNYTLTEADIDTSLKFVVIPVSDKEPNPKTEFESQGYTGPAKPIAENVKLKKNDDNSYEIEFDYKDINGYAAGEHIYSWYRAKENDINSEKTKIDGADKKTYTLTNEDTDCYIFASVTPQKVKDPIVGNEVFAKESVTGYFKPSAKNVTITGDATVGNIIGVNFIYSDLNDDIEGESEINWYVGGENVGKDRSLTLTDLMLGQTVYVEVTPVSNQYPYKGETVKSNEVTVAKKKTGGSYGGGSSSSGGSSYKPTVPTNPVKPGGNQNTPTNESTSVFSDIEKHWAKDNIKKAYEMGIVNGVGEKEFAPEKQITRAEIAAMLVRGLKIENTNGTEYDDVNNTDWYYDVVAAISEKGIMQGAKGSFRPNDSLTREELAVTASRIIAENDEKGAEITFDDEDKISSWAREAVEKSVGSGLMLGKDNNRFAPKEIVTRAEAVTVILRIIESMEG